MNFDAVNGAQLNTILKKNIFKHVDIYNDDVKVETGLSIQELIMCWIFDSTNNFQKELSEWRDNNKLMNFEEIQGYSNE